MHLFWVYASAIIFAQTAFSDSISKNSPRYNNGKLGHQPHLEFHSSPEFAPLLQVNKWDTDAILKKGSHIFVRHDGNATNPLSSPLILDAYDLSAVYIDHAFENVFGPRVQESHGQKYLTFWAGTKASGISDGYGYVYNSSYHLIHQVSAQNLTSHSDLHEFTLTGHGTALVTAVEKVTADMTLWEDWIGPTPYQLLDSIIQEIDLETNEVLFNWRAFDHVSPMDSYEVRGHGWDVYHTNSIQKTKAGNYLVCMRHTHSILLIDGKTGDILWTLGGKKNSFVELPARNSDKNTRPALSMQWQHHARFVEGTDGTEMTLFDNYERKTSHGECTDDCSRGLHISINDTISPPTVQIIREYLHPAALQAQSQGSMQPLDPKTADIGNVFIGWGRCPGFTEHTSTGETVLDVQLSPWHSEAIPDALDNYRAYKMDWTATPYWNPSVALGSSSPTTDGNTTVFVSWNGATEVHKWVVRGSVDKHANVSDILATSLRMGFETKLEVGPTKARYIWVEAVDVQGNILRSSNVTQLPLPASQAETSLPHFQGTMEYAMLQATIYVGMGCCVILIVGTIIEMLWRGSDSPSGNECLWKRRAGYSWRARFSKNQRIPVCAT